MNNYRLAFIEALGQPQRSPPPRRVRYGSEHDLLQSRKDRCQRVYQVLLDGAGEVNDCVMDRLWVDAQIIVSAGRDLQ